MSTQTAATAASAVRASVGIHRSRVRPARRFESEAVSGRPVVGGLQITLTSEVLSGASSGALTILLARDDPGRRAIAALHDSGWAPAAGSAAEELAYFLIAHRTHVLCLSDNLELLRAVAARATRPGDLRAFTEGSLRMVTTATGDERSTRPAANRSRRFAGAHGLPESRVAILETSHVGPDDPAVGDHSSRTAPRTRPVTIQLLGT